MTAPHDLARTIRRGLAQTLVSNLVLALPLFLAAGTFRWPQAWIFFGILDLGGLALAAWLARRDPALLRERTRSALSADQRPFDRLVVLGMMLFFMAWLALIALDARRFAWSHLPAGLQAAGALLMAAAYGGWAGVLRANTFATSRLRVQTERNQTVVSSGPYAVVRHPMYAWTLPLLIGASLLLGSAWSLVGALAILPLLAARVLAEEELLVEGLPGYRDYTEKVRFRLVPGVW